jgi:hypothetical protein
LHKAIYLLNVNGYSPEITALTYPLIRGYARKIGADVVEITERRFPDWPVTYEKLQIHELGRRNGAEWHIYIDSDALIHPETPDWTCFLPRDTVAHNGSDFAGVRWRYNEYLLRDGRNIGSCNWLTIASDWCLDLWRPLEMTPEEAIDAIHPTVQELKTVITREHLVDDYALSCNIARFGLKFMALMALEKRLGFGDDTGFYWHAYTVSVEEKVKQMKHVLEERWKL